VIDGRDWNLTARTDGSVIRTVPARDLFRQIAHSAWSAADPGLQTTPPSTAGTRAGDGADQRK